MAGFHPAIHEKLATRRMFPSSPGKISVATRQNRAAERDTPRRGARRMDGGRDWSRRAALLLLLAPLGGCGFHPLYAKVDSASVDPALASIHVARVPDRLGQLLTDALRERLNPTGLTVEPRYELSILLSIYRYDTGIQRDASSTRGEVQLTAQYTLRDIRTTQIVRTGQSRATGEFNIVNDGYATTVAELDARERSVRDLSQDLGAQLAIVVQQLRAKG